MIQISHVKCDEGHITDDKTVNDGIVRKLQIKKQKTKKKPLVSSTLLPQTLFCSPNKISLSQKSLLHLIHLFIRNIQKLV